MAVISLIDVLHTDNSEEARIIAALSLYKIGDARGFWENRKLIFTVLSVKHAVTFSSNLPTYRLLKSFLSKVFPSSLIFANLHLVA